MLPSVSCELCNLISSSSTFACPMKLAGKCYAPRKKKADFLALQMNGHAGQLPVVVLSAVRVSPRRLQEFHPLAYLPKPFPMDAILRLAAEAAKRRNGDEVHEQEDDESLTSPPYLDEEDLYA